MTGPYASAAEIRQRLKDNTQALELGSYGPRLVVQGRVFMGLFILKRFFKSKWRKILGKDNLRQSNRVVVANTFSCWPPYGGGQMRVLNFYRYLSERADITLVSLAPPNGTYQMLVFNEHFREFVIPQTEKQYAHDIKLQEELGGIPATDVIAIDRLSLTPDFKRLLGLALLDADVAVSEHPYCFRTLQEIWKGRLVYHAHNVESVLKKAVFPQNAAGRAALAKVESVERECCRAADRIFVVTKFDMDTLNALYGVPLTKMFVVPNGTNLSETGAVLSVQREENKRVIGFEGRVAIYIGSMHPPNVEGALAVIDVARRRRDWLFVLVGSMCESPQIEQAMLPQNILMLGRLSEPELQDLLAAVDLGLNPIISGSGSSLKMLTYMMRHVPTLTTPIGNRGYNFQDGAECFVAEIEDFPSKLDYIAAMEASSLNLVASTAYETAVAEFQWADIVAKAPIDF
jgi:hypothetical protein